MKRAILAVALLIAFAQPGQAAEWRLDLIPTPGTVQAIDTSGAEPIVAVGERWFRLVAGVNKPTLAATTAPQLPAKPDGALPDGRIAIGKHDTARAWLAEPTTRYRHGALGDTIEAGSLVIERRNGTREVVRLGPDAVFEDLDPRITTLDHSGREFVVLVKSYVKAGSALAVIGQRDGRYAVLAETPPIGTPQRWLNPAGIADFNDDGLVDIALVQMPHAVGRLELWSWRGDTLQKLMQLTDTANHAFGTRVQRMSAIADFDGDGKPDLAIPSFDRRTLRLIGFVPSPHDIARIKLPARAVTEVAAIKDTAGKPAVILGLDGGALAMVRMVR